MICRLSEMNNENDNLKINDGIEVSKEENKGIYVKRKHIVISSIILLALIIALILGLLSCNNCITCQPLGNVTIFQTESSQGEVDIDPNANEWNGKQPKASEEKADSIKIPGYPSISLPANTKDVTVALLNPDGNPCYFRFEIVLKDTGESLYKSKLVPPGKAITSISLSRPLAVGEYDAVIKVTTTSLKDNTPMNGANVETILKVK